MAVISVHFDGNYTCKTADQPISVNVIIGDGQTGTHSVYIGTDLVGDALGVKSDIAGKRVSVYATVTDTLDETNWTSITVNIVEGDTTTPYGPYRQQATTDGDTVIYHLQLLFA